MPSKRSFCKPLLPFQKEPAPGFQLCKISNQEQLPSCALLTVPPETT